MSLQSQLSELAEEAAVSMATKCRKGVSEDTDLGSPVSEGLWDLGEQRRKGSSRWESEHKDVAEGRETVLLG